MSDAVLEKAWIKFAHDLRGEIISSPIRMPDFSQEVDNVVQIATPQGKVTFVWGNKPDIGKGQFVSRKTTFSYSFPSEYLGTFKVYKKEIIMNLSTIFNKKRMKIGDSLVDSKYIFIASDEGALATMLPSFKSFITQTSFFDFVVNVEELDSIKYLNLQVNKLIVEEGELNLYNNLGQNIFNSLNGA